MYSKSTTVSREIINKKNNIPKINPLSEVLATKKTSERKVNIWKHLYDLNKPYSEKREQLYLQKKIQEEENSLKECTFKPILRIESCKANATPKSNLYKRTQQWKKTIDER